jgi:hypothetical protein
MRRGAAVAASVASGAAASVALAAHWQPIFRYGRPGGGARPDHPMLTRRPPIPHVTFIMQPNMPPVEELLSGSAG